MASRPPIDDEQTDDTETATLALGCFWGPDARFGALPGVVRTRVGYCGGDKANPTYHDLGDHTETIQVDFDPETVSYRDLVQLFFDSHNPVRPAMKRQYASIVFFHDDRQRAAAQQLAARFEEKKGKEPATDIRTIPTFWRAEDYHQKYRLQQLDEVIGEFREMFETFDDLVDSTAVARANGYAAGHGGDAQFQRDSHRLGLSENAIALLRDYRD